MTTTNLLPPVFQEQLRKQDVLKLVYIIWVLTFAFLASLALILLAIRFSLQAKHASAQLPQALQEQEMQDSLALEAGATNKAAADVISWYGKQRSVSGILDRISGYAPSGVVLHVFRYTAPMLVKDKGKTTMKNGAVSVGGFAPTRQDLLELRSSMEQDAELGNVFFPASNWVQPQDVLFSFQFEIK
ncbi:MAG: hypothetical protein Q7R48_02310 [bacterium]|nr:hypothetical protein [bacterium]